MASKIRRGVADAKTQRVNIRLTTDAYRRLGVHSLMTGVAPGKLVESLIEQHLRDFRVQSVRSANGHSPDSASQGDGVNLAEASAA
jgi:hypothetical protein